MSDRSGRYDFWMIHSDGSGLRKATETTVYGLWGPRFSPDGKFLSAHNDTGTYLFETAQPMPWKKFSHLPPLNNGFFIADGWTADGKKLIGEAGSADGTDQKILVVYSTEQKTYEQFPLPYVPVEGGLSWITPSKLLILANVDHLLIFDTSTKKVSDVEVPSDFHASELLYSPAQKALFLRTQTEESDIWLMSFGSQ